RARSRERTAYAGRAAGNYRVSPGDDTIHEPYAYVGRWNPRRCLLERAVRRGPPPDRTTRRDSHHRLLPHRAKPRKTMTISEPRPASCSFSTRSYRTEQTRSREAAIRPTWQAALNGVARRAAQAAPPG